MLLTKESASDDESLNSQDNALHDFFENCPTDAEEEMADSIPLKNVVGSSNAKPSLVALAGLKMNMGLDESDLSADFIFHLGHTFEPSDEDRKKEDPVNFFFKQFKEGIHGFNKCMDDLMCQEKLKFAVCLQNHNKQMKNAKK